MIQKSLLVLHFQLFRNNCYISFIIAFPLTINYYLYLFVITRSCTGTRVLFFCSVYGYDVGALVKRNF